ncbi:hypothetical protein [Streptomyces carminius]|uniref:hypothetical protein n=1 Tax=Streptomyces carminius TaxID=2665496 RepID=UPI0011B53BB5|nr:hypothetical protein [Streptomyces carminius]
MATGNEPRNSKASTGVRVEIDLPDGLNGVRWRAILAALTQADRYGHTRADHGATVWAEIDQDDQKEGVP